MNNSIEEYAKECELFENLAETLGEEALLQIANAEPFWRKLAMRYRWTLEELNRQARSHDNGLSSKWLQHVTDIALGET